MQLNELLCDLEHTTSPERQSPRLYKMARIAISEEEMISKLLLAISLLDSNYTQGRNGFRAEMDSDCIFID